MASKIIYVLVAMILLNLGTIIFTCPLTGSCSGSLSESNSTVIDMASNPTTVGSGFWQTLFGSGWGLLAAIGVVGAAILVGTTIFGKNIETTIYLAIGLGLASVVYPAVRIWQLINGLGMVGDTMTRTVLAIAVASVIFITVVFTVLDWSRGRE